MNVSKREKGVLYKLVSEWIPLPPCISSFSSFQLCCRFLFLSTLLGSVPMTEATSDSTTTAPTISARGMCSRYRRSRESENSGKLRVCLKHQNWTKNQNIRKPKIIDQCLGHAISVYSLFAASDPTPFLVISTGCDSGSNCHGVLTNCRSRYFGKKIKTIFNTLVFSY